MELSDPLDSPLHEVLELAVEQLSEQYNMLQLGDRDDSDADASEQLLPLHSCIELLELVHSEQDSVELDPLLLVCATVLLEDAVLSEQLGELAVLQLAELLSVLLECWLVVELVLWLLQDCVLYDCSDGLLPLLEQRELAVEVLQLEDDSVLLLLPTVLLLDAVLVDALLHELCELWLVLVEADELPLLSVQPSEDRLHEAVDALDTDALDVLALDSVHFVELHVSELAEEHDGVLELWLLVVQDEDVLSVELVLGVDQLLDSVEIRVLQLGLDDGELADDWARLMLLTLTVLADDSLHDPEDAVLGLYDADDGVLRLRLE